MSSSSTPSSISSNSSESSINQTQDENLATPSNTQMNQQVNAMIDNWFMMIPQVQALHMQAINELASRSISTIATVPKPKRKRKPTKRNREGGAQQLQNECFAPIDSPERVYNDKFFRRRFRMTRPLFLRVVDGVVSHDPWFTQRADAIGRLGLTELQKCTSAIRFLAYGSSYDQVDEYMRMATSTVRDCVYHFVEGVIAAFGDTYLRAPNPADLAKLLHVGAERGFPGMIGSIDCMHWEWQNCPMEWKGQFTGRDGRSTIILEVVASYDLWIWHAFFGVPGAFNDINVLDRSPLFDNLMQGRAPPVQFEVNGHQYDMGYYLTDGIYPKCVAFMPSIRIPRGAKAKRFSQVQESCRKDVERAFGVLQARFKILREPSLIWDISLVRKIMICCIILHNMIVEDERDKYKTYHDPRQYEHIGTSSKWQANSGRRADFTEYLQRRFLVRDTGAHQQLKDDLVEHIWQKFRGRRS